MADNVKEVVDVESDDEALLEQLEQEDAAREETEQEQEPPKKEEKKEEKPEKPRPPVKPFVHLHVHTEFSLLDGATRLVAPNHKDNPLVDKAIEKGMPGMAITDHGNMFGVFTFYKAMKKAGLKPVIGCEFYTCENMHEQTGRNGSFNATAASTTSCSSQRTTSATAISFSWTAWRTSTVFITSRG